MDRKYKFLLILYKATDSYNKGDICCGVLERTASDKIIMEKGPKWKIVLLAQQFESNILKRSYTLWILYKDLEYLRKCHSFCLIWCPRFDIYICQKRDEKIHVLIFLLPKDVADRDSES